ncbi:MAG: DUF1015 domain-containing protein [Candidatus Sabulitectum sp.]|nr:DUF1015 domain-containing protein [Candidatus Sabulitectum sp.]
MSVVRPFRGLRPSRDFAEKIASPPYDVLDSREARDLVKDNPLSFLRVVKPEVDLAPEVSLYSDEVYQQGARNLRRLMEDGLMVQDGKPCFYFYRQIMGDHSQTGLVASVSAEDYDNNIIKKHEFTRKEKEEDRIRHIETQNAQCGPVFLTYPDLGDLDEIQKSVCAGEPEYDFTADDGIQHTFWVVSDREISGRISGLFTNEVPFLYVADGHHRSASGAIIAKRRKDANSGHTGCEEYNYFLAVIFPKSQMKILAYNRAVQDLKDRTPQQFIEEVSKRFSVEKTGTKEPSKSQEFSMYLDSDWYTIMPLAGTFQGNDPVKSLDASILQENLLNPVLGVENPRTAAHIKFVGGIRGTAELEKLVDSGKYAVAFSMYPTSVDQLIAVADSGNVMPPKSTWFEPKLRSGLVVHAL